MICEANLVAFASCVDDKVIVEIEQEAACVFIVDFATTIGFVLRDDFTAVFLFGEAKIKIILRTKYRRSNSR